ASTPALFSIARTLSSRASERTVVRTVCPAFKSCTITWLPTNPDPPVTNTVLIVVLQLVYLSAYSLIRFREFFGPTGQRRPEHLKSRRVVALGLVWLARDELHRHLGERLERLRGHRRRNVQAPLLDRVALQPLDLGEEHPALGAHLLR